VADDLRLPPHLERVREILYRDLSVAEGTKRLRDVLELREKRRELIEDLFERVRRLTDEQE
jgi:hypothetical protein